MGIVANMDLSGYNRWSVADIGRLVTDAIKHYQDSIPYDDVPKSQAEAREYAVGQVLRLGAGMFNPATVKSMVLWESSVWKPETMEEC